MPPEPPTPISNLNIGVLVNGSNQIVITPASVDLSAKDANQNPLYAQPCTLTFNLTWAQNLANKPFRFLQTSEDTECGIDITVQNSTEPSVASEFTWPSVTTTDVTSVIVTDNNSGGGTYNFDVTVKDKNGNSVASDPSIKNRN